MTVFTETVFPRSSLPRPFSSYCERTEWSCLLHCSSSSSSSCYCLGDGITRGSL